MSDLIEKIEIPCPSAALLPYTLQNSLQKRWLFKKSAKGVSFFPCNLTPLPFV